MRAATLVMWWQRLVVLHVSALFCPLQIKVCLVMTQLDLGFNTIIVNTRCASMLYSTLLAHGVCAFGALVFRCVLFRPLYKLGNRLTERTLEAEFIVPSSLHTQKE